MSLEAPKAVGVLIPVRIALRPPPAPIAGKTQVLVQAGPRMGAFSKDWEIAGLLRLPLLTAFDFDT